MRPCVIGDEVSQDLDEVLAVCRRQRFQALEIRSVWNSAPAALTDAQCREVANRCGDAGVEVAAFSSAVFKAPIPREARSLQVQRDMLVRALDQCAIMRSPLLRVFSFFREGDPDAAAAAEVMDGVLPTSGDVVIAVETGTRTNTPTARHAQALVDLLGRPDLGVVWDPGNTVFSGFGDASPDCGLSDLRSDLIRHVHVKDPAGTREYVELGRGDVPWPHILSELRRLDYSGFVSLETHWRIGRTLSASERDRPWDAAFTDGGYEASERCMKILRDWLDR